MKMRLAIVFALLVCLCPQARGGERFATSYETEFLRIRVTYGYDKGAQGVFDRDNISREMTIPIGQEYPVLREDKIIGLFEITHIGKLNVWGKFHTHDREKIQLKRDDQIIIPVEPVTRPSEERPINETPPRILFSWSDGAMFWCFVDRGAIDGIDGGVHPEPMRGDIDAGDFEIVFAGRAFSYGTFLPSDQGNNAEIDKIRLKF
jgi:hypothetical protein